MHINNSFFYIIVTYFLANIKISAGGFFDTLTDYSVCYLTECCSDAYIPGDIQSLKQKLTNKVFGQHIVQQELVAALDAHYNGRRKSRKPLVLSFHGTPGTGKSMVANMIVESVYAKGLTSKFVHIYNGRVAFPLTSEIELYNKKIANEVIESLKRCPRSMFIFNEVNKMPAGIFESLATIVDYRMQDVDNSQAVFIFISNTAGIQISDHLGDLMKGSLMRSASELSHFEDIIRMAAFNLDGGLKKTGLIGAHVIDHFIPFLPLEEEHVRECIKAEYYSWLDGDHYERTFSPQTLKNRIDEIIKKSVSFDSTHGLFVAFGCKGLDKDVALDVKRTKKKKNEL